MIATDGAVTFNLALLDQEFNVSTVFPGRNSTVHSSGTKITVNTSAASDSAAATFPRLRVGAPSTVAGNYLIRVTGKRLAGEGTLFAVAEFDRKLRGEQIPGTCTDFAVDLVVDDISACVGIVLTNQIGRVTTVEIDSIVGYAVLGWTKVSSNIQDASAASPTVMSTSSKPSEATEAVLPISRYFRPVDHPIIQEFRPWSPSCFGLFNADNRGANGGAASTPAATATTYARKLMELDRSWSGEEIFEWIFMLAAILEARGSFSMIEAGAGYGRWSVAAALAVRRRRPGLSLKMCAIEAEPEHYRWLRSHMANNGILQENQRLFNAAVDCSDGEALFVCGDPGEWFGQAIVDRPDYKQPGSPDSHTIRVPTISLNTLLANEVRVDLIDFDIQGAELTSIRAGIGAMNQKVKRAFVATHSAEIDHELPLLFRANGWYATTLFRCATSEITEFGEIDFQDGVQCWVNAGIV